MSSPILYTRLSISQSTEELSKQPDDEYNSKFYLEVSNDLLLECCDLVREKERERQCKSE